MKQFETKAIRTQSERTQNKEHAVPVYLTSSFVFEDAEDMRAVFAEEKEAHAYSRYSNPNLKELVEKMCALEGTETGITAASGMSGIFTTFATFLNAGDHILSCASIFGSTHSLLVKYFPKWNISHTFFDAQASTASLEELVQPNTKMLFVETPTNPAVDI
ncbi:MAG: aminotransferase class I/II-fold pyridoxal phosphate-dependent enzyme, partial [Bacteroidota bacterium]